MRLTYIAHMPSTVPDDFTVLLNRAAGGDGMATNAVWSRSYGELLAIARGVRPAVRADSVHAPSPTTIIHESFVKTFGPGSGGSSRSSSAAIRSRSPRRRFFRRRRASSSSGLTRAAWSMMLSRSPCSIRNSIRRRCGE